MNETLIAPKAETPTGQKSFVLNPTTEPPVIAPENPDVIELTISEVDRQTASDYFDRRDCLVCTVLRNNGYNVDSISGTGVTVEGRRYVFDSDGGAAHESWAWPQTARPFYSPDVVGQVIRLRGRANSVPSA